MTQTRGRGCRPLATAQFIGLNALRTLTLGSLILVVVSTVVDMVINTEAVYAYDSHHGNFTVTLVDCEYLEGSSVPNQFGGLFRTDFASLSIIFQITILGLSEVGWPNEFFDRYFPVLGPDFGLGALGTFQCVLSIQILSHFVEDLTLVAAFVLLSLGCINILLGFILGQSAKVKRSIKYWRASIISSSQDNLIPVFTIPLSDMSSTSELVSSIKPQDDAFFPHQRIREKYYSVYN